MKAAQYADRYAPFRWEQHSRNQKRNKADAKIKEENRKQKLEVEFGQYLPRRPVKTVMRPNPHPKSSWHISTDPEYALNCVLWH